MLSLLKNFRDVLYFDIILNYEKHIHFHLFELEHFKIILVELEHLPEHLMGKLFGGNTTT